MASPAVFDKLDANCVASRYEFPARNENEARCERQVDLNAFTLTSELFYYN